MKRTLVVFGLSCSFLFSQTPILEWTVNGKWLKPYEDINQDGVNELVQGIFSNQTEFYFYDGTLFQPTYPPVDIPGDEILIPLVTMRSWPIFDFDGDGEPDILGRKISSVTGNDVGFQIRRLTNNDLLYQYEDLDAETYDQSFVKVYRVQLDIPNWYFVVAYQMFDASQNETDKTLIFSDPSSVAVTSEFNFPSKFRLNQNFPNPFNPVTNIPYQINKSGHILLNIYDIKGRLVETLVNKYHEVGSYSAVWNPKELSSGQYFYLIEIDGQPTTAKKAIFLK